MKKNVNKNLKPITSTDKSYFLTSVPESSVEYKLAGGQIKSLAKFPEENPFPVLRIKSDGTILYSNPPGLVLLEQWGCRIGQKAPEDWCKLVSRALKSRRYLAKEAYCNKRIFSFAVAPVADEGYANLYGRDITKQKRSEDALRKSRDELDLKVKQRTAELSQTISALQNEVQQRIGAEKVIEAERQRFNNVLEMMPAYTVLLTPDYHVAYANRFFEERFGEDRGRRCYEYLFNQTEPCETCETYTVLKTNKPHHWEWTGPDGRNYDIYDFPFTDSDGSRLIMEIGIDITELKLAEKRSRVTNKLLEQFATKTTRKEYLDSIVEIIRDWSGCRCVGIRLTNADGYIPYEACVGFSEEFLSLESNLCLKKDVCACVRVVAHTTEPQDAAVMTKRGSFRCDNTFSFVDSLSENEKKRYRGNCFKAGFASVAVVPISYRQNIFGAIHIADEREGKVPLDTIEFLEDMAAMVGEAVHRFNVEESLLLNEQRLLDAQRITHLGNWEWDIIKNRLWWSDEVYRIFGLEPGQFGATYHAFLSYVHPDDRKLVEESVNKALYEGQAYNIDHRVVRPNGRERTVNERAEVTYDSERRPVKMLGTVHDITERKKAENEIRESQRELRALTTELQLVEEQERRKIAQDLHDSIGQILSFSGRELKALQKSLPDRTAKSIQEITNQLDSAVEQTRTLSFDLSPSTLYDLGFEIAIEELVDRISKERKIQCQFENCQSPKPLTDDIKVLLYRSIRELLINAVKHANAGLIKVSLLRSGPDIHIKIEDDGDGFDVSILKSGSNKGFGIFSIRERLNHIGGHLKIESDKGKGTKAVLIAPLDIEDKLGVNL